MPEAEYLYDVALADVDADGRLDLIVSNSSLHALSVFSGRGDGSFNAAVYYTVGTGPPKITTVDLNGDHRLDLVVANFLGNDISVLLHN